MHLDCYAGGISTRTFLPSIEKLFLTLNDWEDFVQAWKGLVAATTTVKCESKMHKCMLHSLSSRCAFLFTLGLCTTKVVSVFLNNKRHYGHVTTSRVESAHAALKK